MMIKSLLAGAVIGVIGFAAVSAQAGVVYSNLPATAEMDTQAPAVVDGAFTDKAGPATLSFTIDGYASLDGQNSYEDDFTLSQNGAAILVGTFNLGGGGGDVLYLSPAGTKATNVDGYVPSDISFAGGTENLVVPITLTGSDTLSFSYTSLSGNGYAGFQGLGDEGWGIQDVVVSVPEPATWAMMLVGFGGLGATLRRARAKQAVAA